MFYVNFAQKKKKWFQVKTLVCKFAITKKIGHETYFEFITPDFLM